MTKGALQHQLADLRKKIKQAQQEAMRCDTELVNLDDQKQQLAAELDDRQVRHSDRASKD